MRLNILLAGFSVLNAVMAAAYFPSHPAKPPSASASVTKASEDNVSLRGLAKSWMDMTRNGTYVVILVSYSLILGLANSVGAMLTDNLASLGASQATAGWVGFAGSAGSMIVGVAIARATDSLKAKSRGTMKAVLVGCTAAAGVCYAVWAACLGGVLPAQSWGLPGLAFAALAFTGTGVFSGAAIPLMFDMAAEQTYPQPEGTMLMGITTAMNAVSLVVLLAPASSFFSWANWGVTAVTLASAVALWIVLPTTAPRYEYDRQQEAVE